MQLFALRLDQQSHASVATPPVPASSRRDWMEGTAHRFAYRCLPLVIANQAGWVLENAHRFTVTWNGLDVPGKCLTIEVEDLTDDFAVSDHFGSGILTFHLPYLFRTAPGVGILARGLPNSYKVGAHALEGFIETDWSHAPFTMNWKLLEANRPVVFEKGEPFCFIQPISVDLIEKQVPELGSIEDHEQLSELFSGWEKSRKEFLDELPSQQGAPWQKDYFKGSDIEGHRTRLHLKEFAG